MKATARQSHHNNRWTGKTLFLGNASEKSASSDFRTCFGEERTPRTTMMIDQRNQPFVTNCRRNESRHRIEGLRHCGPCIEKDCKRDFSESAGCVPPGENAVEEQRAEKDGLEEEMKLLCER